jgi:hypothetical protein
MATKKATKIQDTTDDALPAALQPAAWQKLPADKRDVVNSLIATMLAEPGTPPPGIDAQEWADLQEKDAAWRREKEERETKEAESRAREILERTYFRTDHESYYGRTFGGKRGAAALLFNPDAAPVAFAEAALSRADSVREMLEAWSRSGEGDTTAAEAAEFLQPLAQEVTLLLNHLVDQLHATAAAAQ